MGILEDISSEESLDESSDGHETEEEESGFEYDEEEEEAEVNDEDADAAGEVPESIEKSGGDHAVAVEPRCYPGVPFLAYVDGQAVRRASIFHARLMLDNYTFAFESCTGNQHAGVNSAIPFEHVPS